MCKTTNNFKTTSFIVLTLSTCSILRTLPCMGGTIFLLWGAMTKLSHWFTIQEKLKVTHGPHAPTQVLDFFQSEP